MSKYSILLLFFPCPCSIEFPPSTVFRRQSCLRTCLSIWLNVVWLMMWTRERCSCTRLKTFSSDTCAVQLIFSILRQIHISKARIRLTSSFLSVQVSQPKEMHSRQVSSPSLSLFCNNFPLLVEAVFVIAILFLISFSQRASSVSN